MTDKNLKILKIQTDQNLPTYGTVYSAGLDLFCSNMEDILIKPNEVKSVPTGIKVEIPEGYFGAIYPRSSTGVKRNLMLANTVGVIDSDYRGEIKVFFYNYGKENQVIKYKDRLAQMIIQPYEKVSVEKVNSLTDSDRGDGGFGSTGI